MADKDKCVWHLGTPCSGKTELRGLFGGALKVPVCENHLEGHKNIMLLHKNNYNVEQMLNETEDFKKQEALTLVLGGIAKEEDIDL
jgi:hypothetical protein